MLDLEKRSHSPWLRSKAERREGGGKVDSEVVPKRLQPQQILTEVLTGNASRRASKLLTRRLLAKPLLLFLQTCVPGFNYCDARGRSRHVLQLAQAYMR